VQTVAPSGTAAAPFFAFTFVKFMPAEPAFHGLEAPSHITFNSAQ
jgi:hypothetical protein